MTNNTANVIKFSICAAAVVGALYLTTVEKWVIYHIILLVLCVATFIWFFYHVMYDNPDANKTSENKDDQCPSKESNPNENRK